MKKILSIFILLAVQWSFVHLASNDHQLIVISDSTDNENIQDPKECQTRRCSDVEYFKWALRHNMLDEAAFNWYYNEATKEEREEIDQCLNDRFCNVSSSTPSSGEEETCSTVVSVRQLSSTAIFIEALKTGTVTEEQFKWYFCDATKDQEREIVDFLQNHYNP
jgi:hypothetical protein